MTSIVFPSGSTALVKKYLSTQISNQIGHLKTDSGFTLSKAIASGLKNWDSAIGIYAGDAQSYDTFSSIFEPIISQYHSNSGHKDHHRNIHSKDIQTIDLENPDPENEFIKSTRIRVARNLKGYSFPCHITLDHRKQVEKKFIAALNFLPKNLKGKYFSLENITRTQHQALKNENLIFGRGDRFQDAAGINTDFPKCRGIFHSLDKKLLIWVNEEDHLRIICMKKSSDISGIYNHMVTTLKAFDQYLDFAWDNTYGFLASCPTNIGTAMRAGVHIQLKKLSKNRPLLTHLVNTHQLQIRGTCGEKTTVENAVFDISNQQRLGISTTDLLHTLHAGITALIKAEKNQP